LARVAPLYDVIRSASALPEVRWLLGDTADGGGPTSANWSPRLDT
jgi:hypothetical protein